MIVSHPSLQLADQADISGRETTSTFIQSNPIQIIDARDPLITTLGECHSQRGGILLLDWGRTM